MEQDGGKSSYENNNAGARYGTGYCDSQCPRDIKFIGGQANVEGWNPSDSDPNTGVGNLGTCCAEMDIWEANSKGSAYTPHPCTDNAPHICTGDSCGGTYSNDRYGGTCDPDGCDFNSWRQGNETFYGPGLTIDTNKKMTVVTQFHTDASGELADIKRFYVQDGKVFANSESEIPGNPGNAINEEFCTAQKKAFGDEDIYAARGGHKKMSEALAMPMVLVLSLWDDVSTPLPFKAEMDRALTRSRAMPTCAGSTPPTLRLRPSSAPSAAPAPRTAASRMFSARRFPTATSSSRTSSSDPSAALSTRTALSPTLPRPRPPPRRRRRPPTPVPLARRGGASVAGTGGLARRRASRRGPAPLSMSGTRSACKRGVGVSWDSGKIC